VSREPFAELARRINENDAPRAVLYLAGGGTEVVPMLLARGGGSATLLSARVPYAPDDFRGALGCDPGKLVDARAARGLAMAAFRHALSIRGDLPPDEVYGIGATSKLSKGEGERPGRAHEIHTALQNPTSTLVWSLRLPEGGDRAWEERISALLLLNLIAIGKGVEGLVPLEHEGRSAAPDSLETLFVHQVDCNHPGLADLLTGRRRWVAYDIEAHLSTSLLDLLQDGRPLQGGDDSRFNLTDERPRLLLPGSFRPLHAGHVAMAEAASRLTGHPCGFELSLFHPEKPPLDYVAIRSRLDGFRGRAGRLYLTDAPTYIEKARLFPGCTFAVGHDTAQRIVDPRFYGGPAARDAMLDELESLGTRFLVFGRVDGSGRFRDFSPEEFDRPVAGFLGRVATPVPGHVFRMDLSSTEIRQRSGDDYA
jgi:hypothetical protein